MFQNFKIKSHFVVIVLIIGFGFVSKESASQSSNSSPFIVHVEALNPDNYGVIKKALDKNSLITVQQACVPASLLSIKTESGNSNSIASNFNLLREIIVEQTGLNVITLKSDYSEQDFNDECASYRMRPSEQ